MPGQPVRRAREAVESGIAAEMAGTSILDAVEASVVQMSWLEPSDRALVELVRTYARMVDVAPAPDVLTRIGPQLLAALSALGGTPAQRKALNTGTVVRGRLAELRAARDGNASSVDSATS